MLKINISTMLILMNKYDKKERERGTGRDESRRGEEEEKEERG